MVAMRWLDTLEVIIYALEAANQPHNRLTNQYVCINCAKGFAQGQYINKMTLSYNFHCLPDTDSESCWKKCVLFL